MKDKTVKAFTSDMLSAFSLNMHLLLKGGISPGEAVRIFGEDSECRTELENAAVSIENGGTLAASLVKTKLFPKSYTDIVATAALTGRTEEAFASLGDYYEKREKILAAAAEGIGYPIKISFVFFAAIILILSYIVPVFAGVYSLLGVKMGGLLSLLNTAGSFMAQNIVYFALALILLAAAGSFFLREENREKVFDKLFLNRRCAYLCDVSDYARKLRMLHLSGFNFNEANSFIVGGVSQELAEKIKKLTQLLREGSSTAEAYRDTAIFDNLTQKVLSTALVTGNIETALDFAVERSSEEYYRAVEKSVSAISPLFMAGFTFLTAAVLLTVLTPMVSLLY